MGLPHRGAKAHDTAGAKHMALYNFHRVLIATAILFFFGFGLYTFRVYTRLGQSTNLLMAISALAVCLGMIAYLIYFNSTIRFLHSTPGSASNRDAP